MSEKQMVEYDSAPRVAYDLMIYIAGKEFDTTQQAHGTKDYWFKLYAQCFQAVHGSTAIPILKES
jgi:hypothetical protein